MKKIFLTLIVTFSGMLICNNPVLALSPSTVIVQKVQDQSTGGSLVLASDVSHSLSVNSGDVINIVVEISNNAPDNALGSNDLTNVSLSDTIPNGLELLNSPATRRLNVGLGLIRAGQNNSKTYQVKVTEQQNLKIIDNTVCYSANNTSASSQITGCTNSYLRLNMPQTSSTFTSTPHRVSDELPNTGAGNIFGISIIAGVLGYLFSIRRSSRNF